MPEIYAHVNWDPSRRELRHFGWALGAALSLATLVICWRLQRVAFFAFFTVSGSLILLGLGTAGSRLLFWPYRVWMSLTAPIGFAVQGLVLALFFYLVLAPVGLAMRLCGRDPLQRGLDRTQDSCWVRCRRNVEKRRYFRQF